MQEQYTFEEIDAMPGRKQLYSDGAGILHTIIRTNSRTINYYRKMYDGSWLNYDCKTN